MASRTQYSLEVLLGARTTSSFKKNISGAKRDITGISGTAKRGFSGISSSAVKAAGLISAAFAAVNIAGGIQDAIDTYSGWEQELTNSAAIANASATEFDQMAKASREAGKATTKTAEESASALGYMALAGWDVRDSTSALMPVLKLSESTNLDLARTSDLVTDSMSAMKLSVQELPKYLDMVTKSQNSSNQTSEQLMEGYIKSGGAVRALGIDAQDTAIMLGILANNGTKGAEGGTALNSMLTRMGSNENAIKAMKKLKISIFDSNGEFVGMEKALKRINKGLSSLNQQDRTVALKQIAGTQYFSKMNYLLDGVKEGADGAESAWDNLDRKLNDSEGTLDEMDEKITGTTSGSLQKMNSALDDVKISFVDAFDGEFASIINDITETLNGASDAINSFAKDNEAEIHQMFEEVTGDIKAAGEVVVNVGSTIVDNFDLIKGAALTAGTAMGTFKAAKGVNEVVKIIGRVQEMKDTGKTSQELGELAEGFSNLGLKGGLVVAGVVAGTAAIVGIGYAVHTAKKKMVEANLEEHFGNISLSLEEIDETAQRIVGKKKLTLITEMLEAMGDTDSAIDSMNDSFHDTKRISWKINAGLQLDSDDMDAYANSIRNYVNSAQDVIDKQGYTVSVATKVLFGENSQMQNDNDAFYAGLDAELDALQKKLNKKINKAVKDGISIEKDEAIQDLMSQISDITSAVTQAEDETQLYLIQSKYSGADLNSGTMKELSKDLAEYTKKANEGAEEARKTSLENIYAQKNLGKLTDTDFEAKRKEIDVSYFETKAESVKKSTDFLMNTITDAYPEVKSAMSDLTEKIDQGLEEAMNEGVSGSDLNTILENIVEESVSGIKLSGDTKGAILEYFKNGLGSIWSDVDALQDEIKNANVEMPENLQKSMKNITALSAVSGSEQDAMYLAGYSMADKDEWAAVAQTYYDAGADIPMEVAEAIENNSPLVKEAASRLMAGLSNMPDATMQVRVTTQMAQDAVNGSKENGTTDDSGLKRFVKKTPLTSKKVSGKKLHKNAKGGIYDKPILTTFAESGAEAAIPLDGSSRAKALWQNAGRILGMEPTEDKTMYQMTSDISRNSDQAMYNGLRSVSSVQSAENASIHISYAPVIEVKGNADEKVITKAMDMSQEKFAAMMKKYKKSKERVAFG